MHTKTNKEIIFRITVFIFLIFQDPHYKVQDLIIN